MLAKITSVSGGIAFSLGLSLIFALSATGAYGLVFNLLSNYQPNKNKANKFGGLFGPFFLLLISNAEGLLEILHSRHIFWSQSTDGVSTSKFWSMD